MKILNVTPNNGHLKSKLVKTDAGFTLIETLIYVAFLSLMMGTLLAITFSTIDSTDQISKKIVIQQEANFLVRKMTWALTGASAISQPAVNSTTTTLSLTNLVNNNPTVITFSLNGSNVTLQEGSSQALQLNSQNVLISNFAVGHSKITNQPDEINVSFTVSYLNDSADSESFNFTKYLRQ